MSQTNTIQCIGVILDGNRRWAKKRGLPQLEGHRVGLHETFYECVKWVRDRNIPHLAVFMFSTENWNRSTEEVGYLMDLFRESAKKYMRDLANEGARIRVVGQRERFAPDLQELIREAERESEHNTAITVWICLSYGGRAEIVAAANAAAGKGEEITEASLRAHMWSTEMPDPDIIIRTGGEMRLSNFLLWQAAYSELFFVEPYWPDFNEALLDEIIAAFHERERRNGR